MSLIENVSRRDFIKYSATAGMSALILPGSPAQNPSRSRAGRIDVHHHCRTDMQGGGRGGPGADWSPAKSLEQMEKFGISTAMISATVPADPFYDGTEKSRGIARGVNEYSTKMVRDYPGRFGMFAALPISDIDGKYGEPANRSSASIGRSAVSGPGEKAARGDSLARWHFDGSGLDRGRSATTVGAVYDRPFFRSQRMAVVETLRTGGHRRPYSHFAG